MPPTFNLSNKENKVKVIIHMGAKKKENKKGKPVIADPDSLVEWNSDIRGMILFDSVDDVNAKSIKFKKLIWKEESFHTMSKYLHIKTFVKMKRSRKS